MIKKLLSIRIPSVIGILLLLIGVGVTSYLVDQGIIFEGRAAPEKEPENIAITNVSPTGFTVLYTTTTAVPGTISYGTEKEGTNVAVDDRDRETGRSTPSKIHHITVSNLNPSTTYYFSILSGDAVFLNEDEPYEVMTAPMLPTQPEETPPITGSITVPEDVEEKQSIVLMTSDDSQMVSALVDEDGSYVIPTTGIRSEDLSAYAVLRDDTLFDMVVLNASRTSTASVLYENTSPIPLILLGQAYDFTISNDPLDDGTIASESANVSLPEVTTNSSDEPSIQIVSPEEEETFSDQQPVFRGKALPGSEIEILIHSEGPISATIEADSDGSWEFRPETPLAPGKHTITIKTRDITGTLREFSRSFTVFAQGSQFVEPSVSPTRTPTPTLSLMSPTPTASPTAVPTPTEFPTPTPTIVSEVTAQPSPTRPPMEAPGAREVVIGGVIGVTTILAGFLLFFLTKGSTL